MKNFLYMILSNLTAAVAPTEESSRPMRRFTAMELNEELIVKTIKNILENGRETPLDAIQITYIPYDLNTHQMISIEKNTSFEKRKAE